MLRDIAPAAASSLEGVGYPQLTALTIRCADFNNDCPAPFTTDDREELLRHVQLHTEAAHRPME